MACSDFDAYWEFLVNWQFYDAVYCLFIDKVGLFLFPLLIFGGLGVALYNFTGKLITPLVLGLILGGVVLVQLPPGPARLIAAVVLFGIGIGGYALIQRLEA